MSKQADTDIDMTKLALEALGLVYKNGFGWVEKTDPYQREQPKDVLATLVRHYLQVNKSERQMSKQIIIDAAIAIERSVLTQHATNCFNAIAYKPEAKDTFEELLRLICGDNYQPIYCDMLRQWIYCVKRRLKGERVRSPFLPIFYGKMSVGKSSLLKLLYSPLPKSDCHLLKDGDKLANSESHARIFSSALVVHLEEMGGMTKADIEKLKTVLDAEYMSSRTYHTQNIEQRFVRASLIGASNTPVSAVLLSVDDNRKWAQIDFYNPPEVDGEKFKVALIKQCEAFDFVNLWQSVNENGDEPFTNPKVYSAFIAHVKATCKSSSSTTEFLDELIDDAGGEFIANRDLRERYQAAIGRYAIEPNKFKQLLLNRGFKKDRTKSERGWIIPSNEPMAKLLPPITTSEDEFGYQPITVKN